MTDITATIAELRELYAGARPGEWEFSKEKHGDESHNVGGFRIVGQHAWLCWFGDSRTYYNTCGFAPNKSHTALIVALHNSTPALLAELDRLRKLEARVMDAPVVYLSGRIAADLSRHSADDGPAIVAMADKRVRIVVEPTP